MARVSNRLTLDDDDNGMRWYADTSFRAVGTSGQGGQSGGDRSPPPPILAGIYKKPSPLKDLEFVDIPTALNSESWPSFYQQTTQEVSGHNFYSFFTARTDFLPKYFLFLISGHFIIFSNKRRLDRICNIFWEIRRESQFSSVLLFSVRFLHINLS